MAAVLLTGHGGFDKLEYCMDVAVPAPGADQVLIRVLAAGVNNTDINTRIGWYSKGVESATDVGGGAGFSSANASDASWSGAPLPFPRIQGADVCGRIVAVGAGVDPARIGERVLVAPIQRAPDGSFEGWMGSECDGGFAQYTLAYSAGAYRVTDALSDTELASFPCAYSTAENLLHRAGVTARDTVLITGASGGVGSAAVQLAKRRGAAVLAVAGVTKMAGVKVLGADQVIARGENLINILGRD
ncbi:MAG: alcohol dehydrogenase catalytic domain-containing protein, partial [Candidatus Competibacteraceae bacterium]|nr:alcohol dehydrogenase catalytic domain-containing protein [Candidatus Competibacteraceae bacterium]